MGSVHCISCSDKFARYDADEYAEEYADEQALWIIQRALTALKNTRRKNIENFFAHHRCNKFCNIIGAENEARSVMHPCTGRGQLPQHTCLLMNGI